MRAPPVPAYLVGTIRVTHPNAWQRYVELVGATFAPQEGDVRFRGAKAIELNGRAYGERIVVAEFPDQAALRR